jgi:hypothetical protein
MYSLSDTSSIVYGDGACCPSFWSDIYEYERDILRYKPLKEWFLNAKCHDGYAFNLSLKNPVDANFHTAAVMGC